ncbi:MAG: T9SS type A sorting domain-containing protein [Muribaculaceae bacterium]|nr:T9SS type A sorting domain-containing protein [Muribaculaceae bacterium]
MKKSTLFLLAAMAVAGSASAQLRWNPENAWATDNGATILPVGSDNKTVVNKLVKGDGQYRADIRYASTANFTENEPYLVVQITTEDCAWNLNDFKFEFMLQRKLSEGLGEDGNVKWGGNTDSFDENYPSFRGDKYKVIDQYDAEVFQLLGSKIADTDGNVVYSEDVIVIDLNNVRATDDDQTRGLLFSAGDVYFPNLNSWQVIVEPDADGMGGVQQRSWMGFVCIAKDVTVTGTEPTFTIHYTGTVEDSSDALTVCEEYANGEGGLEVRDGDVEDAVSTVAADNFNVYLKNGKSVVANGAQISVYTVDGKLVMSGVDTVELPAGIFVVKAEKDGVSKTVKAIARR